MSTKVTWITFAFAVVAVLLAVMTSGAQRGWRVGERGSAPLLSAERLSVDSVTRIMVERQGELQMVFERGEQGAWRQVEPFAHAMDAFAMRQLITAAHEVMMMDRLSPRELRGDLTLATLGLQPADATITYTTADHSWTVSLGRRGIAGRAYAMMNDDHDVLIVSQQLHERVIETSPKEWRDRLLFRNISIDCDRIVREAGGPPMVLERDRRTWRMIEPVRTRVDRETLEMFMQQIGGARSGGFITDQPENVSRFGLAPAAGSFSIVCTHAAVMGEDIRHTAHERKLLIGNPAGAGTQDRFGMIDGTPTIIRVPVDALQGLFLPVESLIDPTGSGVVAADVKTIRIVRREGEVQLERELDTWFAVLDDTRHAVSASVVEELLAKLTTFRAPEVGVQEYPHELEVAVVTFLGFDGRPMDTVRIVHDVQSGQWGLENGDNVLRVFPSEFHLPITPREFGLE